MPRRSALWGKDVSQVSTLYAGWYTAAAGDAKHPGAFARLVSVQGGAQESRFRGGSQEVALKVAAALGKRVRLNSPVRSITQTKKGVKVVAAGDNTPESGAPGVILGFVGGRFAEMLRALDPAARKQAFVDELAAALGAEARGDSEYFDVDWTAERFTRGCPTGTTAPGVLSRCGAHIRPRRRPVGRASREGGPEGSLI